MNNFYTITRYYGTNEQDLEKLWHFIEQVQTYSNRILIGVNIEKDLTDCIKKYSQRPQSSNVSVDFIPIQPWIGIASPLNILLNHIPSDQTTVLIQSIEIQCNSQYIDSLQTYLQEDNILCVGAALDGHEKFDHQSSRRYVPLQGDTSPWNTLIIWNLEKLRRTGFPMCADYVNPPGMEDSAVIALQQKLFGGMKKNRALLIHFDENVQWSTQFDYNHERCFKHQIKMQSKNTRTKQLLQMLDISKEDQIGVEFIRSTSNA